MKLYLKQGKKTEIITDKPTNDLVYDTEKQEWLLDWEWKAIPFSEWKKEMKHEYREFSKTASEKLLYETNNK